MIKFIKALSIVIAAVLLQTAIFPHYLLDSFHPNLLVIFVVYLGLRSKSRLGSVGAFSLGLLHDCFSGIYFGINGFSYLLIFHVLHKTADRLYTDSRYLMVLTVFLATIATGLLNMLLLFIFSAANGIYATLLPSLIPQALVNALIASIVFMMPASVPAEEQK